MKGVKFFVKKFLIILIKPLFQFPIIICNAFITLIVEEQAERQTVSFLMLYYTRTTFFVIWASSFRANTFFRTRHLLFLRYVIIF